MTSQKLPNIYRPHPLFIVLNLGKFLFLLLIPLLRGLLHVVKTGFSFQDGFHMASSFSAWVSGAWLDLLFVFLFLSLGVLTWYLFTVETCDSGLEIHKGVFIREVFFLPSSRYTCVTVVEPFLFKPLGGVTLRIDTPGGGLKKADLSIPLRKKDCEKILFLLNPLKEPPAPGKPRSYHPRSLYVFVLAAITSNSFAGVVLITTFIAHLGDLLGQQFSERIYGTFEEVAKTLAFGIPPAAAAMAYVLLFGYLCAFVVNLFRHGSFRVCRQPGLLEIKAGLFTNRSYLLPADRLCYVDIRRNFITVLLGLSSVFLYTVGFGKYKDDVSALIPCSSRKDLSRSLNLLLPEYILSPRTSSPRLRSFLRYTLNSLAGIAAVFIVSWGLLILFPNWGDLIRWGAFLCLCPSLWFLAVRVIDLFTAGVSCRGGYFTLRYSQGFTLHRVIIPRDKIANITTTRSLFQLRSGRCDLFVFSYSEGSRFHRIRDLPKDEVDELFA